MIRGVSFKIPQISGNVLWQMLKCIDVKKYNWYNIINQCEVWENYNGGVSFEKEYYDGKRFLQNIMSEYYIIFLKLQAYFDNGKFSDIHTYKDFQESDCQLLLLIYDCEYVEIYSKDITDLNLLYENALKNNYIEIGYITGNNDGRTKMDIL